MILIKVTGQGRVTSRIKLTWLFLSRGLQLRCIMTFILSSLLRSLLTGCWSKCFIWQEIPFWAYYDPFDDDIFCRLSEMDMRKCIYCLPIIFSCKWYYELPFKIWMPFHTVQKTTVASDYFQCIHDHRLITQILTSKNKTNYLTDLNLPFPPLPDFCLAYKKYNDQLCNSQPSSA